MSTQDRYRLIGSTPSPYSNKLRALMRYRRIPHDWVPRTAAIESEIAHVKPQLVPMLRFPTAPSTASIRRRWPMRWRRAIARAR